MSKLAERLMTINNVYGVSAAIIATRQGRIIEESPMASQDRTFSEAYDGSSRLCRLIDILHTKPQRTIVATSRLGKYVISKINPAAFLCLSVNQDALMSVVLQAVKTHSSSFKELLEDVHDHASKKSVVQHTHPGRWERPIPKDIPRIGFSKRSMW